MRWYFKIRHKEKFVESLNSICFFVPCWRDGLASFYRLFVSLSTDEFQYFSRYLEMIKYIITFFTKVFFSLLFCFFLWRGFGFLHSLLLTIQSCAGGVFKKIKKKFSAVPPYFSSSPFQCCIEETILPPH